MTLGPSKGPKTVQIIIQIMRLWEQMPCCGCTQAELVSHPWMLWRWSSRRTSVKPSFLKPAHVTGRSEGGEGAPGEPCQEFGPVFAKSWIRLLHTHTHPSNMAAASWSNTSRGMWPPKQSREAQNGGAGVGHFWTSAWDTRNTNGGMDEFVSRAAGWWRHLCLSTHTHTLSDSTHVVAALTSHFHTDKSEGVVEEVGCEQELQSQLKVSCVDRSLLLSVYSYSWAVETCDLSCQYIRWISFFA